MINTVFTVLFKNEYESSVVCDIINMKTLYAAKRVFVK